MIAFWIAALALTALAAALMFLYARRPVAVLSDPAQTVYRRQLTEIDEMAERGLLGEDERKSAYAEAARRLLAEPGQEAERAEDPRGLLLAAAAIGAVGLVAVVTYLFVGKPNMPDQPFDQRVEAWRTQPLEGLGPEQILALLERAPAESRNDPGYLGYLAQFQADTGDLLSSQRTLEKLLRIAPGSAPGWLLLAEVRMELADGDMTEAARQAAREAVRLDPSSLEGRYILARDAIDSGRRDEGLASLRELAAEAPPQVKARLDEEIAAVERGPAAAPAPNGVAANPQIQAMVEGLAARLADNPNDVEGWARLIRSYEVMGDAAARDAALEKARRQFQGRPRDLAVINEAMNAPQGQE